MSVIDVVVAAAAALKEHDEWVEAAGWERPHAAYNYQDRAVAFLDAMGRFGFDPRTAASRARAPGEDE